jgi:hypothetical protein
MSQSTSGRRVTSVPVTTMEELPLLSDREEAELRRELAIAEDELKAGAGIAYEPKRFRERLLRIFRSAPR